MTDFQLRQDAQTVHPNVRHKFIRPKFPQYFAGNP